MGRNGTPRRQDAEEDAETCKPGVLRDFLGVLAFSPEIVLRNITIQRII
jgi:hypothetical protein